MALSNRLAIATACVAGMAVMHTALFSEHAGCIAMPSWIPHRLGFLAFACGALACALAIYGRRNRRDEELLAVAMFTVLGGGALILSPAWHWADARACPTVMGALSIGAVAIWFAWAALVGCATFFK